MLFWRTRLHLSEVGIELPEDIKIIIYKNLSFEIND